MFRFSFDSATGILRVKVAGSWTLDAVQDYAEQAGPAFVKARHDAGRLRLLVDLSGADVLSRALMEPLARAGMQYARSDDRVALLVASTLLKLQMKRMIGDAPTPILLSEGAAIAWLGSEDEASLRSAG